MLKHVGFLSAGGSGWIYTQKVQAVCVSLSFYSYLLDYRPPLIFPLFWLSLPKTDIDSGLGTPWGPLKDLCSPMFYNLLLLIFLVWPFLF